MSEDEFVVERYFGDVEKGVLAKLMDGGEHAVLHSCCSGVIDEVRVGSPFCIPLEPALYSDLVPMLREGYDKTRSEYARAAELPCKSCPHRAERLTNCAPCCPSLAKYIKEMPAKIGLDGKLNPKPCVGCEVHRFGKNVCAKLCQSIEAIQGGTSVIRGNRDTANGGRHRRGKQGCL